MNQKLQRKKPHHTWSNATSSYFLKTQHVNTPIQDRILLYEEKYLKCMQSRTELSNWMKTNKEKGLPEALNEGYIPPSRSTRSTTISSLGTFLKKATPNRFSITSSIHRFSLPKTSSSNLTEKYNILPCSSSSLCLDNIPKSRASLLITPSLSTIRLLSPKSHFLKRQSMLA